MQRKVHLSDLERSDSPHLAVDCDVCKFTLLNIRFIKIAVWFEPYLIIKNDDELAFKPLSNILLRLAGILPLAHLELDGNLLGF